METYVLSFSNPYLSPSIKLEHGSLVSQGSNINVKEIHNIYISSEYEIPKFTCFSTVHGTCELKFQSPMPNNHCFCHLTDHIKKMPFIKLLCKCVCSQFQSTKTHTGNLQPAFTVYKSKHLFFKTIVSSFLKTLSNAAPKVCVCSI